MAGFIGQGAIVKAQVAGNGRLENGLGILESSRTDWRAGQQLKLLVRPDDIQYVPGSPVQLTVIGKSFRGAQYLYELALPDGQAVPCLAPSHADVLVGDVLPVEFDLRHVVVFNGDSREM